MERCFILNDDASFAKDMEEYFSFKRQQREFVVEFCKEHGIESNKYLVGGTGFLNVPFTERHKKNIGLSIAPTEADLEKFRTQLKLPSGVHGLQTFKVNSKIAQLFAQGCVDKQIVINLDRPFVGDSFKSIGYSGARSTYFTHNGKHYLKISSDRLKEDDVPAGFTPIKTSEFHVAQEEFEAQTEKKVS